MSQSATPRASPGSNTPAWDSALKERAISPSRGPTKRIGRGSVSINASLLGQSMPRTSGFWLTLWPLSDVGVQTHINAPPQGFYILHWFILPRSPRRFRAPFGGSINQWHGQKATHGAETLDDLLTNLRRSLAAVRSGAAFEGGL